MAKSSMHKVDCKEQGTNPLLVCSSASWTCRSCGVFQPTDIVTTSGVQQLQMVHQEQQTGILDAGWSSENTALLKKRPPALPDHQPQSTASEALESRDIGVLKTRAARAMQEAQRLTNRIQKLQADQCSSSGGPSCTSSSSACLVGDSTTGFLSMRKEWLTNGRWQEFQETPANSVSVALKLLMNQINCPFVFARKCCPWHGAVEVLQASLHGFQLKQCKTIHSFTDKQCQHCLKLCQHLEDVCMLCGGDAFYLPSFAERSCKRERLSL